ncbi:protein kinase domain containing protein [Acanthamoeba castellanii str. Neff]|uniref:non-specific serine/threonine protein kinase n=1 Tax=Acanthamoeba castellanii (strain ATCC 30010 / Neff) TaxID=1257118 RepID=L8GMT7_ACACF|nr:protein kinase domain containing protein [Acanthamoeba castellanii str. Neff]ELR14068.1 protein kinase domain containing protein [Acanthamoeba castellanii str. Neff]
MGRVVQPGSGSTNAEIEPEHILLGPKIGDGSFGTVYKSKKVKGEEVTRNMPLVYQGKCFKMDVAVKVPRLQRLNALQLHGLRTEIAIMSANPHPCIVLFMGACTQEGQFRIVTELLEGDLYDLIHKQKVKLSLFQKMKLAKDAALGMNWLHHSNPRIIHRDLKLANLLIYRQGDEYRVKLCDFGLSAIKESSQEAIRDLGAVRGTPLYMAPEVMRKRDFNEKADVYSFGIVLWELLTEQKPFEHHRDWNKFLVAVGDEGERPIIPEASCPPALFSLIEDCWRNDVSLRPDFEEINERLDGIIIDSAIEDEVARTFWKADASLHEYALPWPVFARKLWRFLGLELPHDPDDPLPAQEPATQPGQDKRTPPHKRTATPAGGGSEQGRVGASPVYNPPPSAEVAQLRCVKALFVTEESRGKRGREVVSIEWFSKMVEWFAPFEASPRLLDRLLALLTQPWFHGLLTNNDMARLLAGAAEGTFLVRFSSSSPGAYTISRVTPQGTSHIRILGQRQPPPDDLDGSERRPAGVVRYSASDDRSYDSMGDVVADLAAPLRLLHPAPGSPYLPLFGDPASLNASGGYESLVQR